MLHTKDKTIITANNWFNENWSSYLNNTVFPMMARNGIKAQSYDEESPPVEAYVNHGRWLVKCECGGCEKVWEESWFMCLSCFNEGHDYKYLRTAFPADQTMIEALLMLRPKQNRNWKPGESILQLQKENEAHKEELL